MNTNTTTEVTIKTDAKTVESISNFYSLKTKAEEAADKAESGYVNIAVTAIPAAQRMGLSKPNDVSEFLRLCYRAQANLLEPKPNQSQVAFEKEAADFLDSIRSDVSNLTSIIMPPGSKEIDAKTALAGRDAALAYNRSLPAKVKRNARIGQRPLLAIVRGKVHAADVIAEKKGEKPVNTPAKTTPASAADTGSAASTPTPATKPGDANAPENQTPETPSPVSQGSEGSGLVVGDAESACRHLCRTAFVNYINNMGMSKETLRKVVLEELDRLMAT